jgi:aarF domain-containing kinase
MRGAALKLGQLLSIQDNNSFPPEIIDIINRVQNSANYMPEEQLNKVLSAELGKNWRDLFLEFKVIPFAAASIGQVHLAVLHNGKRVAVKVQYPGISKSISSDLENLKSILKLGSLLPKGLYLDNTIRVAKIELLQECDYKREADSMETYANLIKKRKLDDEFEVPEVYRDLSTDKVLTSEFVDGFPIGEAASKCNQQIKNKVIFNLMIDWRKGAKIMSGRIICDEIHEY